MLKDVYIKGDWKLYTITASGRTEDTERFLGNIRDFAHENRELFYKKSRHHIRFYCTYNYTEGDWVTARYTMVAKEALWQKLQRFMYVEQKEEHFADYSLVVSPAQSELACYW